jgi:hypothetical protein
MSERDYWDEESIQKHRETLIQYRNELNPITDSASIKLLDEEIENLRIDYIEAQIDKKSEQVCVDDSHEEPKTTFKEKLSNALGTFGTVLYFLIRLIISILPFVMIGGNFFLTLLLISINTFVPFASAVFWIWGLVCAIKGVQDIWAIIYYIAFVLIWIPFFISKIVSIFSKE